MYRVRRKYPEALNALAQARQHGYAPVEIELERARLAAQQGQQPEARLRLRKALQQQPELKQNLSEDRLLKKYIKSL
ncbi:MAG: hypothetical protein CVV27_08390 [Candidatus Melainabacteria bacterium HGW-Melainabacteria-1]|nr:MAG: hypothetical protein CVV27_08390 [Candidatus Melainabacteria bacterium HGW-Melainabacteria-1]